MGLADARLMRRVRGDDAGTSGSGSDQGSNNIVYVKHSRHLLHQVPIERFTTAATSIAQSTLNFVELPPGVSCPNWLSSAWHLLFVVVGDCWLLRPSNYFLVSLVGFPCWAFMCVFIAVAAVGR